MGQITSLLFSLYQPLTWYYSQEKDPLAVDHPAQQDSVTRDSPAPVSSPLYNPRRLGSLVGSLPPSQSQPEGELADRYRFLCPMEDCGWRFDRGTRLRSHLVYVHPWYKPYECECGLRFSRRDSLSSHLQFETCTVYWHNDEIWQRGMMRVARGRGRTCEEDSQDRLVERIMADAKIAQDKRDMACQQAWSRS